MLPGVLCIQNGVLVFAAAGELCPISSLRGCWSLKQSYHTHIFSNCGHKSSSLLPNRARDIVFAHNGVSRDDDPGGVEQSLTGVIVPLD